MNCKIKTVAPIQFRIGKLLLERIDKQAKKENKSRNEWIKQAALTLADSENEKPLRITASELLCNRRVLTIRLEPYLVELMDILCEEKKQTRTVWLLNACMSKLSKKI